jgi:lysophospholipase L1-like esterase
MGAFQQKLLFVGDSHVRISGGNIANGQRFATSLYNSLTGWRPIYDNSAVPGITIATINASFQSLVLDRTLPGDIVFIAAGINDLRGGTPIATVQANLITFCSLCLSNDRQVIHSTPIPGRLSGDPTSVPQDALTLAANMAALAPYCTAQVNPYLNAAFNSATSNQNTTFYWTDGLHLNDVGYDLWASIAQPVVQPVININLGRWK